MRNGLSQNGCVQSRIRGNGVMTAQGEKAASVQGDLQDEETGEPKQEDAREVCAEDLAGPISWLTFGWVIPFVQTAYSEVRLGVLGLGSLPAPPMREGPEGAIDSLEAEIRRELALSTPCSSGGRRRKASLLRAVLRWQRVTLRREVLRAVLCASLFSASPLLLRQLVRAMSGDASLAAGYLSAAGMAVLGLCGGLLQQRSFHAFTHLGRQLWAGLVGNMFLKLACLDSADLGTVFTEGQILSMIGQDTSIFPYMSPFFSIFLVMPFNIILPSVLLFIFLGKAFAVGLTACILVSLFSGWAASAYKRLVAEKLKLSDTRLVLVNEALQGVRSVKLCAWEQALEERITKTRDQELRILFWIHACYALQQGVVACLPVVGTAATFLTHVGLGRTLDAETVAMTIGYFEQLSLGFLLLPNCKMQLELMSAGITRISRLLLRPQVFVPRAEPQPGAWRGIRLAGASFRWRAESAAAPRGGDADGSILGDAQLAELRELSVCVGPGELVAVVGSVASGKSTLAAGVFGFARLASGECSMVGQAAYVPQQPQILNASVRENVLFGLPFDSGRYNMALRASCLEFDLGQLTEGDETEIGEKGITISGGQRARVALARAYYADSDVVVLDDPLSAMDAHVGATVFQRCILELRRQGKAVLFMTNQLQFCSSADKVVVLEGGRPSAQCSFAEVAAMPGSLFATYRDAGDDAASPGQHAVCKGGSGGGSSSSSTVAERGGGAGGEVEAAPHEEPVVSPTAAGLRKTVPLLLPKRASGRMSTESVSQGRVGFREWQQIARSGQSTSLNCLLLLSCVLVPTFMYISSLMLGIWTTATREAGVGNAFAASREVGLYVSAGLLFAFSIFVRVSSAALYFLRVSRQLHSRMLASVLRQPMVWYDTTPLGRVLNRFSQDVALMDLQLPRLFEFTVQHCSVVTVGVLGAAFLAWPTLIFMVPAVYPLWKLQSRYGTVSLHLQRLMLNATSPVMSQASGFLTALDTIRAFGRERLFAAKFTLVGDEPFHAALHPCADAASRSCRRLAGAPRRPDTSAWGHRCVTDERSRPAHPSLPVVRRHT
mmetsp:Transcript_57534/g.186934  ORF Transcript_57534/g.186934 Transcript_57534/m.186934 type:complete len:1064 (-) Transcript_57534:1093-4284(-)